MREALIQVWLKSINFYLTNKCLYKREFEEKLPRVKPVSLNNHHCLQATYVPMYVYRNCNLRLYVGVLFTDPCKKSIVFID